MIVVFKLDVYLRDHFGWPESNGHNVFYFKFRSCHVVVLWDNWVLLGHLKVHFVKIEHLFFTDDRS